MLVTPRTFALAQIADRGRARPEPSYLLLTKSRREQAAEEQRARSMLVLHQTGSVKIGEVIRYTVTYTPAEDRILPSPPFLHVRIRNTSAVALRAAYVLGPYTIHAAAYPVTFNPNKKIDGSKIYGAPEFEPNVKPGSDWKCKLTVPEHIRSDDGRNADGSLKSTTWIIELASQAIFSDSASVNYEVLVARDERSLDLGFTAVTGNSHGVPGKVQDHQQGSKKHVSHHPAQPKGVYSKAIKLVVDDTTSLWNKPQLPQYDDEPEDSSVRKSGEVHREPVPHDRKQKKIHLVILTHGLHSNLGADMLYMKESIDASVRQARENRKQRQQEDRDLKPSKSEDISTAPLSGGQQEVPDEDMDDEEVIVRGFPGNVVRTERGIQYLGKRLAKYVLGLTYPDQPFLPVKKTKGQKLLSPFSPAKDKPEDGVPAHEGSSVQHPAHEEPKRAYKFTSISFIGHSLGGLVQTYAIAYIHKHSPDFFDNIKPINFVAMASPFLGLSNENPMYVKFALDFGLVGRTGKDLGLSWRTPTLAKSGWSAMVSGFGAQNHDQQGQYDPGAKPLLRILPTGPAHLVLRMFRNRTVYSNVVNDGIVPLRTSCLLFLDWRGLDRVEKARRENGLIGVVAQWSYGQLTGQNSSSPNPSRIGFSDDEGDGANTPPHHGDSTAVPLPGADVTNQDDEVQLAATKPSSQQSVDGSKNDAEDEPTSDQYFQPQNTIMQLWSYIRPTGKHTSRDKKMFKRSQTVQMNDEDEEAESSSSQNTNTKKRPLATRGDSMLSASKNSSAPPKTTIFESAGDLISPPVPPPNWINDPSTRARTIFHDRVYHPEDIPPPPVKKVPGRTFSGDSTTSKSSAGSIEEGGMRVEEKIARAYHKDLSWRKVLVRLEPDAHNNMIVRRMFANAYGWPVVKHLCDTHFGDTYAAETRDEHEPAIDRAKGVEVPVSKDGEHVKGQEDIHPPIERTESELREQSDELSPLKGSSIKIPKRSNTGDSSRSIGPADWDQYFDGTSDEDDEHDDRNAIQRFLQPRSPRTPSSPSEPMSPAGTGTSEAEIANFLNAPPQPPVDMHRGLGTSPGKQSTKSSHEPDSLQSLGGMNDYLTQAPTMPQQDTGRSNVSNLGLRGSLQGPDSPEGSTKRSGSNGVSEHVARLSQRGEQKDAATTDS